MLQDAVRKLVIKTFNLAKNVFLLYEFNLELFPAGNFFVVLLDRVTKLEAVKISFLYIFKVDIDEVYLDW